MKKLILILSFTQFLLFSWLAVAAPKLPAIDKVWEEISNDDGILIHRKEVPDSSLVAFRGEAMVDASLAKVSNILIDTSRKKEWVARIEEAKNVREISLFERIEYNHTASGFFAVRDRDFVFNAKGEFDKANRRATFRLKSVEDPLMPETDKVRGWLNESAYILTEVEPGKKTHVVVEIHADPRGSVPKWLVNLFQKSWPRRTLEGIRTQAAKPDVTEHAGVKAVFQEEPALAQPAVLSAPLKKISATGQKKAVKKAKR
ncbi:MAG: START domain-containing protein [Bdellovibrionota bacterium]